MSDEKLANALTEGRMISAVDNVIFPTIEKFISGRIEEMCAKFRSGETDFIADVSYIVAMRDIQINLKRKQSDGNRAYEKLENQKLEE